MADQNQAPTGLMVKLPFATPAEFLARYGTNITRGGIYLRSKTVKAPGTPVTLELKLADGARIIYASAVVEFVTGQKGEGVPGMGLRFLTLDPETKRFIDTSVAPLPHAQTSSPPLPSGVGPAEYQPGAGPAVRGDGAPAPGQAARPARPQTRPGGEPVPSAPAFDEPTEEPKRTGPIIGIDMGTTNSCVAYVRNGKPAVLTSREGYNTVPSIIALNARGKLVVGHPAKGQMLTNPRLTVYGAKRLVGRSYESPVVREIKDRFHYEIAPGANGEAAVKLGDRVYTLQQICALILREVREVAQNQLGQPVSRAVVTVPAYYNDNQRHAVREAGRLAGIYVERIVNEPTAAALAYGYGRNLNQRILVYDLGGGTFDASVLELSGNVYEVVSTGGDTFLGGIDFDNALVEYILNEFKAKAGRDFHGDRVAMQRITDAAERAKCALSERSQTRIQVPFITMIDNKPFDLDITMTREKLVELTSKLVDRTLEVCDQVLKAKGLSAKDVDEILLVGGQSRFPLVHEKITKFFGKPPSKGVHPDEAVALGAALLAHSLGQLDGVVLIDVLPMPIGIGLPGGRFKPVIERNSKLPATKRYVISNSRDDQSDVELSVFQGEAEKATDNEYLGTMRLTDLPPGPRGSVKVEITFEVSNEALLKVTAKELSTGRVVSSTFSTQDTPEAVKAKMQPNNQTPAVTPTGEFPAIQRPAPVPAGAPAPEVAATAAADKAAPKPLFGWVKKLLRKDEQE